jgi:hypothetical protein
MDNLQKGFEFRIMPSGDGHWYWELITQGRNIVRRGISATEPDACREAADAARQANLLQ